MEKLSVEGTQAAASAQKGTQQAAAPASASTGTQQAVAAAPTLPLAKRIAPGSLGQKINIHTNSFAVTFQKQEYVYRYLCTFLPEISQEQISLRKRTLSFFKDQLEKHFKGEYFYDGVHVISLVDAESEEFRVSHDGQNISILLEKNRDIKTTDVSNQEVQMVVNVLLKKLFGDMNLLNFNRSYFDPTPQTIPGLQNANIKVFHGFSFNVTPSVTGLQACVALAHKVVQSMTVREFMTEIERDVRTSMQGRPEQEMRDRIIIQTNEMLAGSVVSLAYDKRAYKIHKVDFSRTLAHTFDMSTGEKISFRDYFQSRWKRQLTPKNLPGLLVHCRARKTVKGKTWQEIPTSKEHDKDNIYLIPDLCHLTGLTEEMAGNTKLMTELANVMRKPADVRLRMIQGHVQSILKSPAAAKRLKTLPVGIAGQETIAQGRLLPLVTVRFQKETLQCDRYKPSWMAQVRGGFYAKGDQLSSWYVIHTQNDTGTAQDVARAMQKLAGRGGCPFPPPKFECLGKGAQAGPSRAGKFSPWEDSLRQICKSNPSFIVAIIPFGDAGFYSCVKSITLERGVVTQCISTKTMGNPKMMDPVCGNCFKQICHKKNWVSWNVDMYGDIPSLKPKLAGTMLVGVDVCHDKKQKGAYGKVSPGSTVGFCATYDQEFTKFSSQKTLQGKNEEFVADSTKLMKEALTVYHTKNKAYPLSVVVYRDGVGDSQVERFVEREVNLYLKAFQECRVRPKLNVIVVQKRVNDRLFSKGRDRFESPPPGTCVDTGICSSLWTDFFLVTCGAPPGATSRPTRYIVVQNESNFTSDELQLMTNKLCCMYENWNGPVRVPSPVMYAHKCAYLYGKLINGAPHATLLDKLHYL